MSKKDAKAYNNRGVIKEKLGKYDEALDNFNKVIELDPNNKHAVLQNIQRR